MPLKSKPYIATYHGTSLCSFCNQHDETESHMFFSCIKLQSVWNFFMLLIFKSTGYSLPSLSLNLCSYFDFSFLTAQHCHSQLIINGIVFFHSATKYCIWTHRNSIVHSKVNFDSDWVKEIKSVLFSRRRIENSRLNKKHSQILKFLFNALIQGGPKVRGQFCVSLLCITAP